MSFSPNIVGFACQWCTYAGADLAGNLRCKYPPSVKLIRVPCSGRVESAFIIDALLRGADGVFVGGCHFGDCHYKEGNYKTVRRMEMTQKILVELGFEPGRFRWEWISGSEGRRFAEVMEEFTGQIQELGPNPCKALPAPNGAVVSFSLDGKALSKPSGTSVAAVLEQEAAAPWLPRASARLKEIDNPNCPAFKCVEVNGRILPLKLAQGLPVAEGMRILTQSPALEKKLGERLDWLDCKGNCALIQNVQEIIACEAENSGLISQEQRAGWKLDSWISAPSIVYDPSLCIRCQNCVTACNEVQEVGAISFDENKGVILVDENKCVRCGQCVHACPMGRESDEVKVVKAAFGCELCGYSRPLGAIHEADDVEKVVEALRDPGKFVVVQFAPSIRSSIGEEFGLPAGTLMTKKLYAALKKAGFDRVWDTNYTADLTIIEEGTELILRLVKAGILPKVGLPVAISEEALHHVEKTLPQFTSCSPGWVKFCETFYPEQIPNLSSAKSPQQMFGAVAKTYAAKELGIAPENVIVVSIMPCTAKKFECDREEMGDAAKHWKNEGLNANVSQDVDIVLTTREAGKLLKTLHVDLTAMPDADADPLIGDYTGAATIFGRTGGVMEAALRTAYELLTGTALPNLEFHDLGTLDGVKRATVQIGDKAVKVAVAHGLKNCRAVCNSIREGGEFAGYQFIEFMCCPGGCIGGGGQPIPTHVEAIKARTEGLNKDDREQPLRKSHENAEVNRIYKAFLKEPVGALAHLLLHTRYTDRSKGDA
jgi:iron-only hydrogenase group A